MTSIYSAKSIGPIEAQARAAALECRRRLMKARPPAPRLTLIKPAEAAPETAQRAPVAFDHHVLAYKAQTSGTAYVLFECRERGITLDDLREPNRKHEMVLLRGELAHHLLTRFGWSYPQIGEYLRRDHSTIIGCVATYCSINRIPVKSKQPRRIVTPEQMDEIRRRVTAGESLSTVARSLGHCVSTIVRRSIESGWYVVSHKPGKKRAALPLEQIKADYFSGIRMRLIAEKYGMGERTLRRLISAQGWKRQASERAERT